MKKLSDITLFALENGKLTTVGTELMSKNYSLKLPVKTPIDHLALHITILDGLEKDEHITLSITYTDGSSPALKQTCDFTYSEIAKLIKKETPEHFNVDTIYFDGPKDRDVTFTVKAYEG